MPLTPSADNARLPVLDIMRGFALCGIIFANLMSFTGFYSLNLSAIQQLPWADRITLFLIDWLIEGKFYTVFSILLGAGFALQLARYSGREARFRAFWRRRMLVLMAIGLLHMFLIWHGDILTLYSVLGLCLLWFTGLAARQLLFAIVILLALPLAIHGLLLVSIEHSFWSLLRRAVDALKLQLGYNDATLLALRTSPNSADVFFANVFSAIPRPMAYLQTGRPFQVLGQFLLGVYLARHFLLAERPPALPSRSTVLQLMIGGLVLSAIYAGIKAATGSPFTINGLGLFQGVVYHTGATLLALGYMGIIARLCQAQTRRPIHKLAVLGRLSLSQYLLQTSLCVLLFYGYGLSLMGQVPFVAITIFGAGILALQYFWGKYWLTRHAQGPMEWLWRKLSR
ncbi:DUF418 domain-containing protein [Exilibacterium tricleocarpae]|uniref:DUF418 domain-containing protein n=1 Tax=Exilibacterium tricleocarpae TaxID=2591008 RepID=A0A545T020_9GAMM|nr:DUF418 domain-containing protein [Exilibacterium tricleocarpae]TQV70576.1 DUF418 domain-containing protein [Exilibacterium tricleocarpae]